MDPAIRAAYDSGRDFAGKPFRSGCYAPFVSLFFNSLGDVLACCKNWGYPLGNIGEQRLPEIWNGRKIKTLRTALKEYRFGAGCDFCEWQIAQADAAPAYAVQFERFAVE